MRQAPADFITTTQALCNRCKSSDWFIRPHLKFLHDAFILAEFVRLMPVEGVWLASSSEQWPDGYVKVSGKAHNIEVTSTHGGRKLGDEYREVSAPTLEHIEDWAARARSIPHYLEAAIEAKRRKHYGSACWLVVYLNISGRGVHELETEEAIRAIKARYATSFERIFVLWTRSPFGPHDTATDYAILI
jgi:hypothetical protein